MLLLASNTFAQTNFNAIATAYVTTTISQHVVFNSTMQQGGTFTLSVLAHNGGGRAGQSDTANVKIEFYTAGGSLVTSANSTYNANLLNPQNICGNPCIDTSVPWSTLTISKTLTSAEAANVAYARVSMYGIDGSYWAGDYGPWYRAPTFQQNGGGNLLYNPEFGPYNGVQAQGWTTSPGLGACQGAWGGSNPCIANSDGTPGVSTVGLVANENGGGPSATGGTTSGTAGGYNNTMTVTNAGTGATAGAAPAPTVTGTSVTYTTRNVVNGNTTTVYRTPVTTTTYSDNTTTTTNGTEALYQTRISSTVVTNKIVNGVLTTYSTPVVKVIPASGTTTLESNGAQTVTTQNVNQGLNAEVFRYDPKNYNCFLGICTWNFTYHTPSTDRNNYGGPVNSYRTTNGMFFSTNSNLPNNDNSLIGRNEGTVIRFTGTISAPITASKPAGTVYRLYFYNNSDDGFKLNINGGTIINQNTTITYQSVFGTTNNGYMDVVAGQTYNLEAWYWNTTGGLGHTLYWDFGDGMRTIPNSAFTDGSIGNIDIDLTGFSYSNSAVVPIEGTASSLWPESDGITDSQIIQRNSAKDRLNAVGLGNRIDLYSDGSNNNVTIEQVGNWNRIQGIAGGNARVAGFGNSVDIQQGDTGSGRNLIELYVQGNGNNVTLSQARNTTTGTRDGSESGGHYMQLNMTGDVNTVTMRQGNDGGASSGHFAILSVSGSSNNLTIKQANDNEKQFFGSVNGNSNVMNVMQSNTGQHYLDLTLTGNSNSASITQKGSGSHQATVNLTNGGGANSASLVQQGATAQSINITQVCTNPAGCSVTVTQGN